MSSGALDRLTTATAADEGSHDLLEQKIMKQKIKWEAYDATKANAYLLKALAGDQAAFKLKAIIDGDIQILKAAMEALASAEEKPVMYLLALFYHICRTDTCCFNVFEDGMKAKIGTFQPLMSLIKENKRCSNSFAADKAAWLLSGIMGHFPRNFTAEQTKELLDVVMSESTICTSYGVLDTLCNLLKTEEFRGLVYDYKGVRERFLVPVDSQSPAFLYKSLFCVWMLSYNQQITDNLRERGIVAWLKEALTTSRVEKVVRLSLTLVRSFLGTKALCEDMVENGFREVCDQLEFEKWRDADLYDEIREVSRLIGVETNALSSFERYEKELLSGSLSWGFIHSTDFWKENVRQFEQNNGRAIRQLTALLASDEVDCTTHAVACHDIGEFVSIHPLGKKLLNQFQVKPVKERVMQLMGQTTETDGKADPELKEVRREALLCCQKLMLNKWQEACCSK